METELNLEKLADDVAGILANRETTLKDTKVLVGEVALVVGATYVIMRLVQGARARRWMRKNWNG